MYTLCTTSESLRQAVEVLSEAEYILLDCEGRDLGCASGALSLISLGTPHASHIYLFDVLSLPHEALQVLFNAVFSLTSASRAKTKVVWDGRMDYVELFYSYTCPIENVLDLQLVDVLSRAARGQDDWERVRRFPRKDFPMSEVRKLQLEEVHILNGMDSAIREHQIEGTAYKNECIKKLHVDNLSEIWMHRPLSSELLAYAASDIERISALYDHFFRHGYLQQREHLLEVSSRYVSMHKNAGKPDPENIFLRGPYLPLSISLTNTARSDAASQISKDCVGCRRMILERHFPLEKSADKKGKKSANGSKNRSRSEWCKICTLILAKSRISEERKVQQKAKEEEVEEVLIKGQVPSRTA